MNEKRDYSTECTHDDDNDKRCWSCKHFVFPIGCMLDHACTDGIMGLSDYEKKEQI